MKTICICGLVLLIFAFSGIVAPVLAHGISALSFDFLAAEPAIMGTQGGIGPVLLSTLFMNFFMIILVLFIGIPAGLKLASLSFSNKRGHTFFSAVVEILASTPSVVFGLFGNAFFVVYFNMGYSIFAGAVTLCLMVLPLFVRIMEEAFVAVHEEYGATCLSLGLSEARTTFRIFLPTVLPSLAAALLLSWTRAVGETAALLVTSGYSTRWPESVFDSGRSLSVHIFDLSMNVPGGDTVAYKSAFVLLLLTLFFSLFSKLVMKVIFKWNFKTAF